jgi:membrane-associated phospholipid phosphatase
LGDTTSFFIGRRLGRGFILRHGPRFKITPERLAQVEGYFDRHGGKTILIGRFIGLVRALAPFVAGSSELAYRRFIPFSIVGCGLWGTLFCVLGYVFWRSFDMVASIAGQATLAFGVTVTVIVGAVWAYRRWLRQPERRRRVMDWVERHRVTRALMVAGRAVGSSAGLGFMTALAVGGVGAYVFVLYTMILVGDPGPTPFDTGSLELANDLNTELGVDLAKVVTTLGSLPAAVVLAAGAAGVLAAHRRPVQGLVLVTGLTLIYIGVHVAKDEVDRPRPAGALVDAALSSFPSGHAAYATTWVAVAVALSGPLRLTHRAAAVLAAIGVAAAAGLSRIYLRVHYWSDVAGGWALGFAVFGTLAAGVLIVMHIRQNEADR